MISLHGQPTLSVFVFASQETGGPVLINFASLAFNTTPGTKQALNVC